MASPLLGRFVSKQPEILMLTVIFRQRIRLLMRYAWRQVPTKMWAMKQAAMFVLMARELRQQARVDSLPSILVARRAARG